MNFDLSEEQKLLADQAGALFSERSSPDRLRELIDSGAEWDEPLWKDMVWLGLPGAGVSEQFGGLGLGALDLGVISTEIGRANAAAPFLSSIAMGATAIGLHGSEAQKQAWLFKLASGEAVATMSYPDERRAEGLRYEGGKLFGVARPIADAGIAHVAIIACDRGLALVDLASPGIECERLESFDQLRPHHRLTFDAAPAELLDADADQVQSLYDRAAVQAAFEAIGGAEACLYMARDYALQRQIFGRSLASYQAIKHKLADVALAVEFARSNALFAAWAADTAPDELPLAAAAARLSASAAFELAARENLHIHGGIGFTFEGNCHFYYRRERLLAVAFGGRQTWADRLMDAIPEARS